MKFGISVYPEQKTFEEIESYLKLASKYDFKKVFTSMFTIGKNAQEIIERSTILCNLAHRYGMEVSVDANPPLFEYLGAKPEDLSIFKEIGIDSIRMDMNFTDERDVQLVNNKEKIKIEFSAFMIDAVNKIIDNGADSKNMLVCHNFYPQRYTGIDSKIAQSINDHWKTKGIPVGIFISSTETNATGPWPVMDGLPSIEEHRDIPCDIQVRHLLAMNNVDEILFGNAFASEEEFKSISSIIDILNKKDGQLEDDDANMLIKTLLPPEPLKKHLLTICFEKNISDIEKKIALEFPLHIDLNDGTSYMLRSRLPRYKNEKVLYRNVDKKIFKRGDVVIVNNNCNRYQGELQLVLKDMKVDRQRNLIGHINEIEKFLIDYIKPLEQFAFIEGKAK